MNIFVKVGVYAVKTVELTTVQKLCCNFRLFLKLFCNEFEESNNLIFTVNNLSLQPQFESYTYKAYQNVQPRPWDTLVLALVKNWHPFLIIFDICGIPVLLQALVGLVCEFF